MPPCHYECSALALPNYPDSNISASIRQSVHLWLEARSQQPAANVAHLGNTRSSSAIHKEYKCKSYGLGVFLLSSGNSVLKTIFRPAYCHGPLRLRCDETNQHAELPIVGLVEILHRHANRRAEIRSY